MTKGETVVTKNEPPKNEVLAPGEMLKFPTYRQLRDFRRARESGAEPVFRARLCNSCQGETPRTFECCSEECYNKLHPPSPKKPEP